MSFNICRVIHLTSLSLFHHQLKSSRYSGKVTEYWVQLEAEGISDFSWSPNDHKRDSRAVFTACCRVPGGILISDNLINQKLSHPGGPVWSCSCFKSKRRVWSVFINVDQVKYGFYVKKTLTLLLGLCVFIFFFLPLPDKPVLKKLLLAFVLLWSIIIM